MASSKSAKNKPFITYPWKRPSLLGHRIEMRPKEHHGLTCCRRYCVGLFTCTWLRILTLSKLKDGTTIIIPSSLSRAKASWKCNTMSILEFKKG